METLASVARSVGLLPRPARCEDAGIVPPPPAPPAPPAKPVDYMDLPTPVKYEELQRESMMSLKPECFEGCRFDFTKPMNQKFSLQHSLFMGAVEVPSSGPQVLKIPAATYEFGANLIDQNLLMMGRLVDGRLSGRVNYQVNDALMLKLQTQVVSEPGHSQAMLDVDYRGLDWQGQLKFGNNEFYGINYLQSVTPSLSLGGEAFWLGQQRKSGAGFAFRHATDTGVATGQIATTGLLALTYTHRVSDKVALATEFNWNWNNREATSCVGYDYMLRQCRLRGKIDSNGVVSALLEERLNVGFNLLMSAEIDHAKKDYRFGFGMTIGE